MTFEQMQQLLTAVVETQRVQNESLRLHHDLIVRTVFGLDAISSRMDLMAKRMDEGFAKHEQEMAEIRLAQSETTDKLNGLIDVVSGLIKGDK